jgi:signal peptidase
VAAEPEVEAFVPPALEPELLAAEPALWVMPESPAPPVDVPISFVPPAPEPAPAPEPDPEPAPAPEPAADTSTSSYSFASAEVPESRVPLLASTEETFFSGPGIWIGEPEKDEKRTGKLKAWGARIGTGIACLVVAIVFLVSIGPKFLPYQTFFVRSGSMSPTFDTGDMIVLTKVDASDLKPQDIITFDRPDKPGTLVTHRIVSIETTSAGKQLVTKGDANGSVDPWRVPATGTGWKYKTALPKIGFVFGYLGTPQARLALLAIPATLLGILSIIDIWKPKQAPTRGRR